MKIKVFFMTAIFVLLSGRSDSQVIRSWGAKIGITQASQEWKYTGGMLSGMEVFDKSRTGLDIGGYVEWFNLGLFSVLTEAHYIQKGSKDVFMVSTIENPEGTGETITVSPRIDYLSFPLLVKLGLNTPILTLYGIAGYRFDFLVGKNKYASGAVFDDLKSTDHGPTLGFGVDVPIGSEYSLGGEFRYCPGSQAIFSNQNLTVKNKFMEFLFTVGF